MPSTLPDLRARLRDLYAEMRSAFKEDARNLDFLSINYVPDHRLRLYYEELEEIQSTKIKRSNGKKDDFSDQDSTSTLAGRKLEQIAYLAFSGIAGTIVDSFQSSAGPQYDLIVKGDSASAVFFSWEGASGFPKRVERTKPDDGGPNRQRKMNDCLLRQALFAVKEKYVVLFDKDDIKDLCLNSENLLSMLRAKIEEVKLSSGLPAGTKADTWEAAAKRHRRQRHERDEQSEKIHRA